MLKPRLALFSPNSLAETPTFTKAHRDLLHAEVKFICDGYRPVMAENYPLVKQDIVSRLVRKIEDLLLPKSWMTSHEKAIMNYLIDEKVEVAFAEFGLTGAKIYKACKKANIPLIVHFHGFDAHMYRRVRAYKSTYQKMFKYTSSIIGVSNYMCDTLELLGAPREKLVHTPCGPNDVFFECQPNKNSNNLIFIGRFIPKKNPEILIKAFARLSTEFPELRLKMGGSGECWDSCQSLVKQLNLQERVELPGNLTHDQVKLWMEDAFAYIQHSVIAPDGDTEGTPVAIMEASAAALPVVATRHAGIKDVVEEGQTGLLVDEHDLEGFISSIRQLLLNRNKADEMGQAGRIKAKNTFSMQHHINALNNCIQRAIN
jgi:colanic acid/amylovoran biosynthesis glycosyltransferase